MGGPVDLEQVTKCSTTIGRERAPSAPSLQLPSCWFRFAAILHCRSSTADESILEEASGTESWRNARPSKHI